MDMHPLVLAKGGETSALSSFSSSNNGQPRLLQLMHRYLLLVLEYEAQVGDRLDTKSRKADRLFRLQQANGR